MTTARPCGASRILFRKEMLAILKDPRSRVILIGAGDRAGHASSATPRPTT